MEQGATPSLFSLPPTDLFKCFLGRFYSYFSPVNLAKVRSRYCYPLLFSCKNPQKTEKLQDTTVLSARLASIQTENPAVCSSWCSSENEWPELVSIYFMMQYHGTEWKAAKEINSWIYRSFESENLARRVYPRKWINTGWEHTYVNVTRTGTVLHFSHWFFIPQSLISPSSTQFSFPFLKYHTSSDLFYFHYPLP